MHVEYQIEAEFQTGTHFQLGSEGPSARSVYGKDFDSTRMMGPVKADREPRPRNSKVSKDCFPRLVNIVGRIVSVYVLYYKLFHDTITANIFHFSLLIH